MAFVVLRARMGMTSTILGTSLGRRSDDFLDGA
jgi:hypothetical protein